MALALMALLAGLLAGNFPALAQRTALQSGQSLLADLVIAARTKAMSSGRKTRLLISADATVPARYLRYGVVQQGRQAGANPADWDTVLDVTLPDGIFVVPGTLATLVDAPAEWKMVSDPAADLASSLLAGQEVTLTLPADGRAQTWMGVAFTANGTLSAVAGGPPPKGTLLVARGRGRAGALPPGAPPIELLSPNEVRGLMLSAYGVPALLSGRAAF